MSERRSVVAVERVAGDVRRSLRRALDAADWSQYVPRILRETSLISVPVMKTHGKTVITGH